MNEQPKFTPGPWSVRADKAWIVQTAGGRRAISTADNRIRSQEEANARLIAAAPEMFQPVIRDWFENGDVPPLPANVHAALTAYCAALAKVEGRG